MKWNFSRTILIASLLATVACGHGIEIVGNGFVVAANDESRSCSPQTSPCEFTVTDEYQEGYAAVPAAGHKFDGWSVCGNETSSLCTFNVPKNLVAGFHGQTMPNTVATFSEVNSSSIEGTYTGRYLADGNLVSARCVVTPSARMLCVVNQNLSYRGVLSIFEAQLQLSNTSIGPGGWEITGGNGTEYWQPSNWATFALSEISGGYLGRESIALNFESGGEAVEMALEFDDMYQVAMPLRSFAGPQNTRQSANSSNPNGDVFYEFDAKGNFSADYGDCTFTSQMGFHAPGINTFDVTAQSDCDHLENSYNGLGYSDLSSAGLDVELILLPDEEGGRPLWFAITRDL